MKSRFRHVSIALNSSCVWLWAIWFSNLSKKGRFQWQVKVNWYNVFGRVNGSSGRFTMENNCHQNIAWNELNMLPVNTNCDGYRLFKYTFILYWEIYLNDWVYRFICAFQSCWVLHELIFNVTFSGFRIFSLLNIANKFICLDLFQLLRKSQ